MEDRVLRCWDHSQVIPEETPGIEPAIMLGKKVAFDHSCDWAHSTGFASFLTLHLVTLMCYKRGATGSHFIVK